MNQPTPIPPLTDELLARLKLCALENGLQSAPRKHQLHTDLTTVLHHLAAYRDAVERWEAERDGYRPIPKYLQACANLSAVHARAKGSS